MSPLPGRRECHRPADDDPATIDRTLAVMTPSREEAGFTLVEVMIALLIFGMIAAAGVALLSFSVRAQATTNARLDDVGAAARLRGADDADLAQATRSSGPRRAWHVATRLRRQRHGLHRGARRLEQYRRGGAVIAAKGAMAARRRGDRTDCLADGRRCRAAAARGDAADVRTITLRYRFAGAWSDRWDGTQGTALPQALELTIERDDGVRAAAIVSGRRGRAAATSRPSPDAS